MSELIPTLTPYDTGVRLEPLTWSVDRTSTDPAQLDRFGRVDFTDDEGATVLNVHVERTAPDDAALEDTAPEDAALGFELRIETLASLDELAVTVDADPVLVLDEAGRVGLRVLLELAKRGRDDFEHQAGFPGDHSEDDVRRAHDEWECARRLAERLEQLVGCAVIPRTHNPSTQEVTMFYPEMPAEEVLDLPGADTLAPEIKLEPDEREALLLALALPVDGRPVGLDHEAQPAIRVQAGHLYRRKGQPGFSELGSEHHLNHSDNDLVYISVQQRYVLPQDSPAAKMLLDRALAQTAAEIQAEIQQAELTAKNAAQRLKDLKTRARTGDTA